LTQVCHIAANLPLYLSKWEALTTDSYVINIVKGLRIPFKSKPCQLIVPLNPKLSVSESNPIDDTIKKLLKTGAIIKSKSEPGQFISKIFTVAKPDGSRRPIINLKELNEFIECPHFKMENLKTATNLISENYFMAVIDLKDAYHSVSIDPKFRKYLKFQWNGQLYQYNCLPFGINVAPRVFTKLLKPVVANLRERGFISVIYLDDILIISSSICNCRTQIRETITLLNSLGFLINYEKSQLNPSTRVRYLGFLLNSEKMNVKLPDDKATKLKAKCELILRSRGTKIQAIAELAGSLTAACPGTTYGQLYTRQIEIEKSEALLKHNYRFESLVTLSSEALSDIEYWIENIFKFSKSIKFKNFRYVITTDASLTGWGAECNSLKSRGHWNYDEKKYRINELELLAIHYGLKTFIKETNVKVLCRTDNSTAMAYVNKFGGCRSTSAHYIAKNIWKWCEGREVIIQATYVNTKDNFIADALSRSQGDSSDFKLSLKVFHDLCHWFYEPIIDLFASYQTNQCKEYYSWYPDPHSIGVDAFTFKWNNKFYAFPPFCLISRTLQKIIADKCEGIVVVPCWYSQPWYPLYVKLAITDIKLIKADKSLLFDPYLNRPHPLAKTTSMLIAVLSGNHLSD